jgi:hypothetical protein
MANWKQSGLRKNVVGAGLSEVLAVCDLFNYTLHKLNIHHSSVRGWIFVTDAIDYVDRWKKQ